MTQLQTDLAAQEARIVDFKRQNQDALPETLSSRQAILVQQMDQMTAVRQRIDALQTERQNLVGQDGTALDPAAQSTESELARLRLQLVQLRALYADSHPEVRAVTARIAALEKASAPAPAGAPPITDASATAATTGPNARRLADIDAQLDPLNKQLADLDARIKALDASVQRTPEVQVALNVLMRDYDTLQGQYRSADRQSGGGGDRPAARAGPAGGAL